MSWSRSSFFSVLYLLLCLPLSCILAKPSICLVGGLNSVSVQFCVNGYYVLYVLYCTWRFVYADSSQRQGKAKGRFLRLEVFFFFFSKVPTY